MQKRECSYSRIPSEEQEAISQFGDGVSPAALVAAMSGNLDNFKAATTPGGIEAQEKAGQIQQSFLETLPVTGTCTATERAELLNYYQLDAEGIEAKITLRWPELLAKGPLKNRLAA